PRRFMVRTPSLELVSESMPRTAGVRPLFPQCWAWMRRARYPQLGRGRVFAVVANCLATTSIIRSPKGAAIAPSGASVRSMPTRPSIDAGCSSLLPRTCRPHRFRARLRRGQGLDQVIEFSLERRRIVDGGGNLVLDELAESLPQAMDGDLESSIGHAQR